jgi:hypothetical protein
MFMIEIINVVGPSNFKGASHSNKEIVLLVSVYKYFRSTLKLSTKVPDNNVTLLLIPSLSPQTLGVGGAK